MQLSFPPPSCGEGDCSEISEGMSGAEGEAAVYFDTVCVSVHGCREKYPRTTLFFLSFWQREIELTEGACLQIDFFLFSIGFITTLTEKKKTQQFAERTPETPAREHIPRFFVFFFLLQIFVFKKK